MKRPPFIGNCRDFQEPDESHYPGSDELLGISAPVGKKFGLQAIGIHIETLLPGRRTSWPHAESAEEEFAYVIEGNAQVWVDGDLFDLKPGDFVAFPSGTGIAHTFLNNTDKTCVLLIGGEANKPENKIFYPLHPERNNQCKEKSSFWEDHPRRPLGPHDGLPDQQRRGRLAYLVRVHSLKSIRERISPFVNSASLNSARDKKDRKVSR